MCTYNNGTNYLSNLCPFEIRSPGHRTNALRYSPLFPVLSSVLYREYGQFADNDTHYTTRRWHYQRAVNIVSWGRRAVKITIKVTNGCGSFLYTLARPSSLDAVLLSIELPIRSGIILSFEVPKVRSGEFYAPRSFAFILFARAKQIVAFVFLIFLQTGAPNRRRGEVARFRCL